MGKKKHIYLIILKLTVLFAFHAHNSCCVDRGVRLRNKSIKAWEAKYPPGNKDVYNDSINYPELPKSTQLK